MTVQWALVEHAAARNQPPRAPNSLTGILGLEQRLKQISVLQLLLSGCNMPLEALSTMTPGQLFDLIAGSLAPILAVAVTEAVHPSGTKEACQGDSEAAVTSRGKYRQTLRDVIGLADPSRSWRSDFKQAMDAGMQAAGLAYKDYPHRETAEKYTQWATTSASSGRGGGNMVLRMRAGFSREEALAIEFTNNPCITTQIGVALSEGSPRYAALTHAGYNALARKAKEGSVAPKCYFYVTDSQHQAGLGDTDPRWLSILTPDETGFRGFTSYAPVNLTKATDWFYSPGGLKGNYCGSSYATDSDIICFESAAPEQGHKVLHSAVDIADEVQFMHPPFTLLTVVKVEAAGQSEYLPGRRINQRLITVRPTFVPPAAQGETGVEANKFATNHKFLSYGNSDDVQRGLAEITSEAPMTMEQEWARNESWVDWTGNQFHGWAEYSYVIGVAAASLAPGEQGGARDEGHEGWTPDQFLVKINAALRENTRKTAKDTAAVELMIEEMLAIRLYTGPAHQPLNEFLREVSKLGVAWRRRLARSHQFSYASTVRHLSNGLRKLARVSNEFTKVYRGVRGELPEAFWLRDAFGTVTATDFGFMSTSLHRAVSEGFLGTGVCVLWEIECSPETDDGFHSGADVSLLSQYPGEKELLFPPLTMLQVQAQQNKSGRWGFQKEKDMLTRDAYDMHTAANGAKYICVRVRPTFV